MNDVTEVIDADAIHQPRRRSWPGVCHGRVVVPLPIVNDPSPGLSDRRDRIALTVSA